MRDGAALHFISGLPRSGSTLLAALLRQNPATHAHITSPLASMVGAMLGEMSAGTETSVFFDEARRRAMLRGLFASYYGDPAAYQTIFDTSRGWTGRIDLLAALFPQSKVICCVRQVPWIIDSVERLIRRNTFELSGVFGYERAGTVYTRAENMMAPAGLIGHAVNNLKQAMHGAEAKRLLLLPYDLLTTEPAMAMEAIYAFTGVPAFRHDFETVAFDTKEFDARLGTPGLHDVRGRVERVERRTILPPDVWQRWEGASIWRDPGFNTQGVAVAGAISKNQYEQREIA